MNTGKTHQRTWLRATGAGSCVVLMGVIVVCADIGLFGVKAPSRYISEVYARQNPPSQKKPAQHRGTSNRDILDHRIVPVSTISWKTVLTVLPNTVKNVQTRGFIEVRAGGNTARVGNGVIFAHWTFDINNGPPSVSVIGTQLTSGNQPGIRVLVTGTMMEVQVQSNDGRNTFAGTVDIQVFAPSGGGENGQSFTYSIS